MEKIIDNYLFLEKIGEGSFSKVKKAKNLQNNEFCAVKIFNKNVLKQRKKFVKEKYISDYEIVINEINNHLQIDHQNILYLHAIINKPNKLYFILEYCEKGCLLNWNEKSKIFTGNQYQKNIIIDIVRGFYNLLQGVKYLHENNIVHFDIKPQNILINNQNQAKLCDFGSARIIQNYDSFSKSDSTLQFLAPETFNKQEFSGKACDIWALGITLFAYFYRKLPWYLLNKQKIKIDHLVFPNDPNVDKNEEIFIQELILQMLQKDPKNRPSIEYYKFFNRNVYLLLTQ